MKYNSETHHRRSIRLKGYDYSQSGLYFITICVQHMQCLFGSIDIKNNAHAMIDKYWLELTNKFINIKLHEYVIMPNHFHGIIEIKKQNNEVILSSIIQWFKTMTTNAYINGVKHNNWQKFNQRLWQRNYYEHIIRDEISYIKISEYIINNPSNWINDEYYED
jgi:putative transposase